jgi:hypothetical protein
VIQPGQDVRISGGPELAAAPSWGSGGFTVVERGSLSLAGLAVAGALVVHGGGSISASDGSLSGSISVQGGGALHLSHMVFEGLHGVDAAPSAVVTSSGMNLVNSQCLLYATVSDAWRSTSTSTEYGPGGKVMSDSALDGPCSSGVHMTGVGGDNWYRFVGDGGDALPLAPPEGHNYCSTNTGGWLTGWGGRSDEILGQYNGAGRYPSAAEGIVSMTACFGGRADPCQSAESVRVVRCDDFLLFRLPYAPACERAYCTAPSGL